MPGAYLWGWTGAAWEKLLTDGAGHLQTDVVSSIMDPLAATAANQVLTHGYIDGIEGLLNAGLPGALVGGSLDVNVANQIAGFATAANQALAIADLGTLVAEQGRCYGWVGAAWYHLLVETAADPNLRVKLFDGANGIDSQLWDNSRMPTTTRGLLTTSLAYAYDGAQNTPLTLESFGNPNLRVGIYHVGNEAWVYGLGDDNVPATRSGLYTLGFTLGFNGARWDRLRSYGTGVLTVCKGAIQPTRVRMTATGRVGVAGAKRLFWIACSPDGPSAEWEITDADAGGGAVVYDHFDTDKHSDHIDFNPPMELATGIWVEKFDHMKSLVFCYI